MFITIQTDSGYLSVGEVGKMPSQVVYQTYADLIASYEVMVKNDFVITDMTQKGLLQFRFTSSRTIFQLSAEGKMQVKWTDISEKRILYRFVKKLLIAKVKEELEIKPLKQQTWIEYPAPKFKLYWCDIETEYALEEPTCDSIQEIERSFTDKEYRMMPRVERSVHELRRQLRFLREPTTNEVALKSGCLDEDLAGIFFMATTEEEICESRTKRNTGGHKFGPAGLVSRRLAK